jgi:AcrR family transcriptional regulator
LSSSKPPYLRIAAALRERIRAGEFAPGDPVPSTRRLTRQWGVAMATATKALAVLRAEGLIRPVPGIGTVVAAPRQTGTPQTGARQTGLPQIGPRVGAEGVLTPERIVSAAIGLADAEGLGSLSMRRVASVLGVSTMALYRHVRDKDDLMFRMLDSVLREWHPPSGQIRDWRTKLETAARTLWQAFRAHPWLAPALSITRPDPIPGGMAYSEYVLAVLESRGLAQDAMLVTHLTLFNYVRGTAFNLVLEADAEASTGMTDHEWLQAQEPLVASVLDAGDYPVLSRINQAKLGVDIEALFETGLRYLIDGLTMRTTSGSPAAAPA